MRKTHKIGISLLAILCLHTSVLAQQSYGMQNHPAPKRLSESLGLDLPWGPQLRLITLLLIGAALIAWIAYFFIVVRMYQQRQNEDHNPGLGAPSNASYSWQNQLANRGSFPWNPSLVGVDHDYPTDKQSEPERESDDTIRG